jgi:hypothetical protein
VQTATTKAIESAIPAYLHYNDTFQNVLFALALGTGGTAPSRIAVTTAYTNTFEPATNKTGRYATIVRDKVAVRQRGAGREVHRLRDLGRRERPHAGGLEVHRRHREERLGDQHQHADQRADVPDARPARLLRRLRHPPEQRRAAARSARRRDEVHQPEGDLRQPLDTKYVGGQLTIIEPEENGFPDVTIELTFARFDATSHAFFAAHRDGTKYKADITFTGAAIDATSFYGLLLQFPNLDVDIDESKMPGGAGQVEPKIRLKGLSTTAAPTGMSASPCRCASSPPARVGESVRVKEIRWRVLRVPQKVNGDGSSAAAQTFPYYPDVDKTGSRSSTTRAAGDRDGAAAGHQGAVPRVREGAHDDARTGPASMVEKTSTGTAGQRGRRRLRDRQLARDSSAPTTSRWRASTGRSARSTRSCRTRSATAATFAQPAEVAAASFRNLRAWLMWWVDYGKTTRVLSAGDPGGAQG